MDVIRKSTRIEPRDTMSPSTQKLIAIRSGSLLESIGTLIGSGYERVVLVHYWNFTDHNRRNNCVIY